MLTTSRVVGRVLFESLVVFGLLVATALSGSTAVSTVVGNPGGEQSRNHGPHVYLTDYVDGNNDGTIVQFDTKQGIVVDPGHILVRGLHGPLGVAVGPDGLVYVAETASSYHQIDVYQISARAALLVRQITFAPGNGPSAEYLAVDANDFLYAAMDFSDIAVFQPGTYGYVRTPDYLSNTDGAYQIGIDSFGDVYQPASDAMYVHPGRPGKPAHSGTRPIIPEQRGWNSLRAMRADGNEVFVAPGDTTPWVAVAVFPTHTWGRLKLKRSLTLQDGCRLDIQYYGLSITVANGLLYEVCGYVDPSGKYIRGIWTYVSSGAGDVFPLGFAKTTVWTPGDIAIGP